MSNAQSTPFNSPIAASFIANLPWLQWFNYITTIIQAVQNVGNVTTYTPINGFSYSVGPSVEVVSLTPVAGLLAGAVVLPAQPFNGQRVFINTVATISTLTVTAAAGASMANSYSAALNAGTGIAFVFQQATSTWYRMV